MRFLRGKDYPHLCPTCRATIDQVADVILEGEGEDTDNEEAPCDYLYDHSMFCGGRECKEKTSPWDSKCVQCGFVADTGDFFHRNVPEVGTLCLCCIENSPCPKCGEGPPGQRLHLLTGSVAALDCQTCGHKHLRKIEKGVDSSV